MSNCRKFFDLVSNAFLNEQHSLLGLLNDKDYLLKNFYDSDENLLNMKNNIKNKLD